MDWRKRKEKLNTSRSSLILSALDCDGNVTNYLSSCLDFPTMMECNLQLLLYSCFFSGCFYHRNRHEARMLAFTKVIETTVTEWRPRFPPVSTQPWIQVTGQWISAKAASKLVDSCQHWIAIWANPWPLQDLQLLFLCDLIRKGVLSRRVEVNKVCRALSSASAGAEGGGNTWPLHVYSLIIALDLTISIIISVLSSIRSQIPNCKVSKVHRNNFIAIPICGFSKYANMIEL